VNRLQLRKLEAYGFKSFADKLEIEFDKGITAIVGPNGSGKSNITDAIRWVLGEQNVRNLRGAKAEDIIFTGSSTRRALGLAEVSLTFDNSDGQLSVDFNEVVITRRLYRSGESEYYINKARCRLKDIYDLFADTGLGRDAISVISQNKIDQVLNSKPEERRLLFEETAGITKYRNRKKESLRKLEDTEQNLLRVRDIIHEIEHQLGPLAEYAEKTKQYNVLHEEYKKSKLTVLLNRYEQYNHDFEMNKKQIMDLQQASQASEVRVNLLEVTKEQLNNELTQVEKSLQILSIKNSELASTIEKNNSDIAIFKERLERSQETGQRLQSNEAELEKNKFEMLTKLIESQKNIEQFEGKAKQLVLRIHAEAAREEILRVKISEIELAIKIIQEKSLAQVQKLTNRRNDLILLEHDIKELQIQLIQLNEEVINEQKKMTDNQVVLTDLNSQAQVLFDNMLKAQHEKMRVEKSLAVAGTEQHTLDEKQRKVQQEINAAQSKVEFLTNMQKEYEGFGRATKSVLKSNEKWHTGICGAVVELIEVQPDYITAVEVALGGSLQNIVTDHDITAKAAINFLKREKLGRVTFLPLNTIVVRKSFDDANAQTAPGFIGYANELVSTDAKYKKIVDFLLSRTLVVDTIEHAVDLARKQGFKARIVTLTGELINPGGSISGGSTGRREASFLNRSGEITTIHQEIACKESELVELNQKKSIQENSLKDLESQAQTASKEEHLLTVQQAEMKIYIEKAAVELADRKNKLHSLQRLEETLQTKETFINQQMADVKAEIEYMQHTGSQQKDQDETTANQLVQLTKKQEELRQISVNSKIEQTVVEQELIRHNELQANIQQAVDRHNSDLLKIKQEKESLHQAAVATQRELMELTKKNVQMGTLHEIGTKDYDNFYQVKMEKMVSIQSNDREIKDAHKQQNDLQNKIHQTELLQTKSEFERQQCLEIFESEYHVSLEQAQTYRLEETSTALSKKIRLLEKAIEELGLINPNAITEYENLNTRYTFMQKQLTDLSVAKDYLAGIIRDMDITMSKQFSEAFAQISLYFSEIFVKLFGGGQAKLELTDTQNVLEAGVEIAVQPPDKKLQNLAVLSGGERALTVIALLFSFLQYRPAPFSVVDEIDAPLDEANVDRFSAFLKEYALKTQFIVVTHRKGTMEAADIMYGVTVEDAGVSRLVSVRLEDALR
jgi:chromosome segregation protein